MHHLAVHRGAEHTRIPVIPLECGLQAQLGKPVGGNLLQVHSRDARLHLAAQQFQHLASRLAREAHLLDFFGRLQYNCQPVSPAFRNPFQLPCSAPLGKSPATSFLRTNTPFGCATCATARRRQQFRPRFPQSAGLHPLPQNVPMSDNALQPARLRPRKRACAPRKPSPCRRLFGPA